MRDTFGLTTFIRRELFTEMVADPESNLVLVVVEDVLDFPKELLDRSHVRAAAPTVAEVLALVHLTKSSAFALNRFPEGCEDLAEGIESSAEAFIRVAEPLLKTFDSAMVVYNNI